MNKKEILAIVKRYGGRVFNETLLDSINEVTSNLQFSNQKTAVFYKISDQKSSEVFKERLKLVDPGLIILNQDVNFQVDSPYTIIDSKNLELFTEEVLSQIYPINEAIQIYGITGTNGKSTCVCLCEQLISHLGRKGASLGTIGLTIDGKTADMQITGTTPSYIDLRRILFNLDAEVEFLFMEVSSHAIVQNRLGRVRLSGAGWTSFSQDHLDYHGTMEDYLSAKLDIVKYFKDSNCELVFPNSQVDLMKKVEKIQKNKGIDQKLVLSPKLDRIAANIRLPFFKVHYNRDNLEVALSLLNKVLVGASIDFNKLLPPKGRFSIEKVGNNFAVVDYAHTPDAIENLVKATVEAFPNSKVITLFGCGGDRDKSKRPLMAEAAELYSHSVVVTSDNPRSEDPQEIINDILVGLKFPPLFVSVDREEAIIRGLSELGEGDVLIIAGKGHEEYQEIKGEKKYFSDFDIVKSYVAGLND